MKRLLSLLFLLVLCVPAARAESSVYYIEGKNADRVHLRAEPSTKADSMGLYYTGTNVILIGYEADWAWVMVGDEDGFIMREYLTQRYTSHQGPWAVVDNPHSTWVNLRMSPSTDGMVTMCPDNGTAVQILGETSKGWSYVDCEGVKGYIMTSLLSSIEESESILRTTILHGNGWDEYIHQYIAPNGQMLYFNAHEREPVIHFEDVNFDGFDDMVIITGRWAKCDTARFYVYDPAEGYVLVRETTKDEGLMNYTLYPEYKLVGTHIANGNAGLCHESCLYRWEGNDLKCIRRAYSENYIETVWAEDMSYYTQTTYTDLFCCNVYDYTTEEPEGTVVYSVGPLGFDAFLDTFDAENAALWQGVK